MEYLKNGINIHINKLEKKYGDSIVLDNIELTIEPGEFIAVVGGSGSGKSTLLKLISGLEEPTSGTIYLNGSKVDGINLDTKNIFQEPRLLPWRRVIDNVKIGAENKSDKAALKALRDVGLEHKARQWPMVLSGGEKQKVSLARAIAGGAKLLLLDDPFSSLDPLAKVEMEGLIEQLWLNEGFTVVLVTYDISEAVTLADRVIVIDKGKITLDTKITLNRPRYKNSDFHYFEEKVLNQVMSKNKIYDNVIYLYENDYSI